MLIEFFSENRDIIEKIISDIKNVSKYANIGLSIALLYVAVYLLYAGFCKLFKRERKLGTDHVVAMSMLLIYMTALIYIVLMSREPGEYTGVNMVIGSSWGRTVTTKAYFIENILLFIPMGVLMPSAFKSFRKPYIAIPSIFLFSCFIETVQYVFELGVAEIDDVITNTAGGIIGLIIYGILALIHMLCRYLKGEKEIKKIC